MMMPMITQMMSPRHQLDDFFLLCCDESLELFEACFNCLRGSGGAKAPIQPSVDAASETGLCGNGEDSEETFCEGG